MHVIPIASGKGGVGKSLVAANLSLALAQSGRRVVLVDLDLGSSNLHLMLGCRARQGGIGAFISSDAFDFEDIILHTEYPNLRFIPGDAEIPGLANIKAGQKNKLLRQLLAIRDADYLVFDLGAGTGSNTLDFFLAASRGLIVTTPSLTATLSAYLFLKNAVFRLMFNCFPRKSPALAYLEKTFNDGSDLQRLYVPSLLAKIKEIDPESHSRFLERSKDFKPRLIVNMLEDPKDAERATKIRRSCKEYLGIELEHLGIVYRDGAQDVALSSRLPILSYKPQSVLSQAIYRIADKLGQTEGEDVADFSSEILDSSFQAAEMEAEIDFESRLDSIQDLLHCGALSMGDMIETIKSQQFDINQVKKENALLKTKLARAIREGFLA